jgi:para-nitrobenzyl esterase
VTVWGQSGGGFSVCAQLAAPAARGLFDKAIVQSAPCGNPMMTEPVADEHGRALAAAVGCADEATAADCLRSKPIRELVRPSDRDGLFTGALRRHRADAWWFPVAGTPVLPLQPLTALRLGIAADVALMHGGTRDEMRTRVGQSYDFQGRPVTATEYPTIVANLFGADAARILAAYPAAGYDSPSLALATLLSDDGGVTGTCTQLPAIDAAARRAPVYAYEYAQPAGEFNGFPLGASHSADLRYLLDTEQQGAPPPVPFTPDEEAFATRLIGYWTAFARTGDPGPSWPAYRRGSATALSIAMSRTAPVDLAATHRCDLWRTVD